MRSSTVALLVGVLVLQAGVLSGSADTTVGASAPDFTLPDASGQDRTLSDYRGSFVVLEWFNPGCPFVKKHYRSRNMQNLQRTSTDQGVVWLTIDSSAPGKQGHLTTQQAAAHFIEHNMSSTALLLDPDGRVGTLYGAKTTPHMFIVGPSGNLIYQGAIDSIASADRADIQDATNYVRQALDEAMDGRDVSVSSTRSYGCSVKY